MKTNGIVAGFLSVLAAFTAGAEDGYVRSLGGQVVNLRSFKTANTRILLDFQPATASPGYYYFGTSQPKTGSWLGCYGDANGHFYVKYGDSSAGEFVRLAPLDAARHTLYIALNEKGNGRHRFVFTSGGVEVTNVTGRASCSVTTVNCPMMLFGLGSDYRNGEYASNSAAMKVYAVRIWEGDALVHDYVPRKVDGRYYLKDLVDGAYITGVARKDGAVMSELLSGGGDIVEEPGDGYIESTGNQRIDLGVRGDGTMRAELDHQLVRPADTGSDGEGYLFGSRSTDGSSLTLWGYYSGGWSRLGYECVNGSPRWQSSQYFISDDAAADPNAYAVSVRLGITPAEQRRTLVIDAPGGYAAYETAGYECSRREMTGSRDHETQTNLGLFAPRIGTGWGLGVPMRFYGLRLYRGGALCRTYRPYIKAALPGVIDDQGGFLTTVDAASCTNRALAFRAGGDIAGDAGMNDIFLETTGNEFIDTGFLPTARTKVVIDFAQLVPGANPDTYLFGASDDNTSGPLFWACMEGWFLGVGSGSTSWQGIGETRGKLNFGRSVLTVDAVTRKATLVQGGAVIAEITLAEFTDLKKSTLALLSRNLGTGFAPKPKVRLYSCQVYDDGQLVRDYRPVCVGAAIGLRDAVNGVFSGIDQTHGAKIRGMTLDGVGQGFSAAPPALVDLHCGDDALVLAAEAPYATSYVWRRDGVVLPGEVSGTLILEPEDLAGTVVYSVTPVYTVSPVVGMEDREIEGRPAETAATYHRVPRGTGAVLRLR